jgi:hypothetical protein
MNGIPHSPEEGGASPLSSRANAEETGRVIDNYVQVYE